MNICIVIDAKIPATAYGGTERVVVWLGRALHALGHKVTFLASEGSYSDFAPIAVLDRSKALDGQVPADTDIVHLHSTLPMPRDFPACMTVHGNCSAACTFHPNTIFVSARHAANHGAEVFVHNGLDPADYGPPDLKHKGGSFVFLGKAAWRLKNVKGAIRVARAAGAPIDILGGTRLNLSMGFRLTLDPNAHFRGMVGGEEKNRYLRNARGLILPVLWEEPFGLAFIEGMYFGLPVFATPYGSLPELVPPHAGHLSNRLEELAAAASHSGDYDREAIHQWCSEHFTATQMARKYLEYYEKILAGETLHKGEINSTPVRRKKLAAWYE